MNVASQRMGPYFLILLHRLGTSDKTRHGLGWLPLWLAIAIGGALLAAPAAAQRSRPAGMLAGSLRLDSLHRRLRRPGVADTTRVKLLIACSQLLMGSNVDSARWYSERAVALARRRGFGWGEGYGLVTLAAAQYYASNYAGAQISFEGALRALGPRGMPELLGHAYLGMGNVATELHNAAAAQRYFAQAQRCYAAGKPRFVSGEQLVLYNRANGYLDARRPNQARPLVREGLRLLRAFPTVGRLAKFQLLLGQVQQLEHHPVSAASTWQAAVRRSQADHDVEAEGEAWTFLSEQAQRQRRYSAQLTSARRAAALFHRLGEPDQEAVALLLQADALAALHRPEAYDTLRRYTALRDTLLDQQRLEAVATAQARFDQAAQQNRIRVLEQQQRIADLETAQRTLRNRVLLGGAATVSLLLAALGRWAYRRRQAARDAALRTRLAADLHDDVGGLLTQISLESALLEEGRYAPAQQQARLHRVAEASRTAARQMRDVVWSVDARNDSFASLLDQMHDYAHEVLAPAGIELSFEADPALKARPLGPLARQSVYLIFKEALHNVAKHAQAGEVRVSLRPAAAGLRLEVRDNGRGRPAGEPTGGQGLRNMRMRAEAVGGRVHYDDAGPGFGLVAVLPV